MTDRSLFLSWRLALLPLAVSTPSLVQASTISVPSQGAPTIQAAIKKAVDGDVIEVAAGTYTEVLDFLGKQITVRGVSGSSQTTINASGLQGPIVQFLGGETRDSVLEGFTLTGFVTASGNPGGMNIVGTSPTVRDVVITANGTGGSGGGVAINGGSPLFTDVTISNNTSKYDGAGVYVAAGSPEFSDCIISGNASTSGNGGAMLILAGNPFIHNCILGSNSAKSGGGIYVVANSSGSSSAPLKLYNNLLTSNAATNLGGNLYLEGQTYASVVNNLFQLATSGGGVYSPQSAGVYLSYSYNDAYSNYYSGSSTDPNYPSGSAVTGSSGLGNLETDPLLTDFSDDGVYTNDDVHLEAGSPLIDAGNPDLLDPDQSRSDIGFYGGPYDPVDSDGDGMSDAFEYEYGLDPASDDSTGDVDGDGLTNLEESQLETDPSEQDTDGDGVSDYDEATGDGDPTDPGDNQPTADAGPDQYVDAGVLVTLDGTGSFDPNGEALSYFWYFESVPDDSLVTDESLSDPTGTNPTFTPDVDGTYTIALVVNDGHVDSVPDVMVVHVAQVLYVPGDYSKIQDAINAAYDYDTILVAAGTYTERLDFQGKAITVSGAGQGASIIDGSNGGSVVVFKSGETSESVLEGFTLINGKVTTSSSNTSGGCVYINESLPTLRDLTLTKCSSGVNGGGLSARWSSGSLVISDLTVQNCSATALGGGIYLSGETGSVTGVTLTGNTSGGDGGGIYLGAGSYTLSGLEVGDNTATASGGGLANLSGSVSVSQSFFYGNAANSANYGGGGAALAGDVTLSYSVFSDNEAKNGYGGSIYVRGAVSMQHTLVLGGNALFGGNIYLPNGTDINLAGTDNVVAYAAANGGIYYLGALTWSYNDVYQNTGGDYVGNPDLTGTGGNLSVDPGFLAWTADGDPLNDRFNIRASSDLVDAGDSVEDPDGSVTDIGLYGGAGASSLDFDGDGVTFGDGDCDDWSGQVPQDSELADGLDNDCDGSIDEGTDGDGDGYAAEELGGTDCDDTDAAVHPGASETVNGVDDNCDGKIDNVCLPGKDEDGDGYTPEQGDCDCQDPAIYPGATDLENGVDDDCDGQVDEDVDDDGDGYSVVTDCNDNDSSIHPGASDLADGLDNDCDGDTDEDVDNDGDGYSIGGGDCDDADAAIHPDQTDPDNDLDDDCDGQIDEDVDQDGDGYTVVDGDCNDTDADIHPGAYDGDDSINNDCDDLLDEDVDADGDGYTDEFDCDDHDEDSSPDGVEVCDGADNDCNDIADDGTECYDDDNDDYTEEEGDCNDSNKSINPGADERADCKDNNCDGEIDEGTTYSDDDGDGYAEEVGSCSSGNADAGGDCDDSDEDIHPGAVEGTDTDGDGILDADGLDNDCDDKADEGTSAYDDDGDHYSELEGDCDDGDKSVHPDASEEADGLDNDCNGVVDDVPETTPSDETPTPGAGEADIGGGSCSCDQRGAAPTGPAAPALFALVLGAMVMRRRR